MYLFFNTIKNYIGTLVNYFWESCFPARDRNVQVQDTDEVPSVSTRERENKEPATSVTRRTRHKSNARSQSDSVTKSEEESSAKTKNPVTSETASTTNSEARVRVAPKKPRPKPKKTQIKLTGSLTQPEAVLTLPEETQISSEVAHTQPEKFPAQSKETPSKPKEIRTKSKGTPSKSKNISTRTKGIQIKSETTKTQPERSQAKFVVDSSIKPSKEESSAKSEIGAKGPTLSPSTPGFFPSYLLKRTLPGKSVINRDKFPQQVITLIDELRIKFPEAKFYFVGAGPSNILDGLKPNDYDILIINADTGEIQNYLQSRKVNSQKRSEKHPVIFCDLENGVSIDFTVKAKEGAHPKDRLEDDFKSRDFNLSALYCEFTQDKEFEVFSFSNALKLRNEGVIEAIGDPVTSFEQDPTRLFRLAKLLITNPNYVLGKELQKAIDGLKEIKGEKPKWLLLLEQFIKAEYGNFDRLDQAMRKLFIRYNYQDINRAFQKLGLLTEFTDNSHTAADHACSKIPNISPDDKYIYWILANLLQRFEDGKENSLSPLHSILNLSYGEIDLLDYVYGQGPSKTPEVYVFIPQILNLISSFNLSYKNTNNFDLTFQ
jgi:tRNA nucleotidyltransferase/poly(A) polymerase